METSLSPPCWRPVNGQREKNPQVVDLPLKAHPPPILLALATHKPVEGRFVFLAYKPEKGVSV
jgi:hypothetical protein